MRDPGHIWTGGLGPPLGAGHKAPVPKVCPECGRPTKRTGNDSHRRVWCTGNGEVIGRNERGGVLIACRWGANVYHGSPDEPERTER